MALGGATLAGGFSLAGRTVQAYSVGDISLVQSARSFQVWLRDSARQSAEYKVAKNTIDHPDRAGDNRNRLAARVASRLLISPIHVRREIAVAMAGPDFFDGVAASERKRQFLVTILREGVATALQSAPTAGDLWLSMAYLETVSAGFGPRAHKALFNSWQMAPQAAALAPVRARFASLVAGFLDSEGQAALYRDLELVRATNDALYIAMIRQIPAHIQAGLR